MPSVNSNPVSLSERNRLCPLFASVSKGENVKEVRVESC